MRWLLILFTTFSLHLFGSDWDPVLDYWLGDNPGYTQERIALWFGKDPAVDAEIKCLFENRVIAAAEGKLNHWADDPHGRLALIILLDQFPRNIYRNTPRAFAFDSRALHLTKNGLALNHDQHLQPFERLFFYIPLEHSEDLATQNQSVTTFTNLAQAHPEMQGALDYAIRHKEIIERFGRYPHRNAILNRSSTPEELEFLKSPNSSF